MNLSGDYTLCSDMNIRIPQYTNIRLALCPGGRAYRVTWTTKNGKPSGRNIDRIQAEQWVRERIWILKHPARIALSTGV